MIQPGKLISIQQFVDGELQYDPIAGSRAGNTVLALPYGQHYNLERWVMNHSTGLVTVIHWSRDFYSDHSIVTFEFTHSSDALLAKLTVGGAA